MQSLGTVLLLLPLALAPQLAGAARVSFARTRSPDALSPTSEPTSKESESAQSRFDRAYGEGIHRRLCSAQPALPAASECAKKASEKLLGALSISKEDFCLRVEIAGSKSKEVDLFLGDGPDFWCEPIATMWREARGRWEVFWANDIKNYTSDVDIKHYTSDVADKMWELLCKPPEELTTTPAPRKAFPESTEEAAKYCAEDFAENLRKNLHKLKKELNSVQKLCKKSASEMVGGKGPKFFLTIHTHHYWCDPVRQEWESWESFMKDPSFRPRVADGVYGQLCAEEPVVEPPVPQSIAEAAKVCARESAVTLPPKLAQTNYGSVATMCKVAKKEIEETGEPKAFRFKRLQYYCKPAAQKWATWQPLVGMDFAVHFARDLYSLLCTMPSRATAPKLPAPQSVEEAGELCAGESAPLLKVKIDKYKPKGGFPGVCQQPRAPEEMLGYVYEESTKRMLCLPMAEDWQEAGGAWEHLFTD